MTPGWHESCNASWKTNPQKALSSSQSMCPSILAAPERISWAGRCVMPHCCFTRWRKWAYRMTPRVQKAAGYLAGLVRENGWPCAVSKSLGNFRGPGRKEDPCPFATLAMLKALGVIENWRDSAACHTGTETLLHLWSTSLSDHPYIFYMGTDFRKLKVPFIWYDLLHVLEVLSHFSWVKNDPQVSWNALAFAG